LDWLQPHNDRQSHAFGLQRAYEFGRVWLTIIYECIKKLVAVCGEDKLAEAYFHSHLSVLESAIDVSKELGTFQRWIKLMKGKKFKDANDLL